MLNSVKKKVKLWLIKTFSIYHVKNKNKHCGLTNLPCIDTFVDIGANSGGFAKKLPNMLGTKIRNLVLVEPDERYAANLHDLHVDGVQTKSVQRCCISDVEGEVIFNIFEDGAQNSLLMSEKFGSVVSRTKVKSITGDTLVLQNPHFVSSETNVLKVDVQGAERIVLQSFYKTLGDFDFIILEITFSDTYQNQSKFLELIEVLDTTHQYSGNLSEVYDGDGPIDYMNAVFKNRNNIKQDYQYV